MLERHIDAVAHKPLAQSQVTKPMRLTKSVCLVTLSLATIVGVVLAIELLDLPANTRLWKELENTGHVLLFGTLALAVLAVSTELLGDRLPGRYQHYLLALAVSVVLAGTTEWIQSFTGRDADLYDALRDVAGAASLLGLVALLDTRMHALLDKGTQAVRRGLLVAFIILLAAPLTPFAFWVAAYAHRDLVFPEIMNFDSFWQRQFLSTRSADLVVIASPKQWATVNSTHVGRLTVQPASYPGLWIQEPYPDWTGYSFLRLDIYAEVRSPIQFVLRIHDWKHNNAYEDRFNYSFTARPGANAFRIPIDTIRTAPAGRELDVRQVAGIALFAENPKETYTIDIDSIRIE